MVGQYLERMKQLGVYDDATIIVTGDHGTWWLTNDELTSASCPILLVKPAAKSGGDPAKPLVSSVAPVSHSDILGTIRASAGLGDGAGPEDDTTVFDFTANDINTRTRYYYTTNTVTRKEVAIVEYAITGDAGSIKNWKLTGVTWDPQVKE